MSLLSKLFRAKASESRAEETEADEPLVIVSLPPLVYILTHRENQKGAPLTEEEVADMAGSATCMTMSQSRAAALADARGYADINPAQAWEEWQQLRSER